MLPQLYRHAWMDGEIDAFREQVRRYVAAEFTPRLDEWRRQGYIPREVWRPFGEMSFLLPEMPETYGGAGASLAYQLVVQDELAKAEMPVNIAVHTIASHYILDFGTEAQKQRWLPKVTNGEMLAAIAMTEPGCGSDLKAISTRARRDGDHYVIDGAKTFITNGFTGNLLIVAARTSGAGSKGCRCLCWKPRTCPAFALADYWKDRHAGIGHGGVVLRRRARASRPTAGRGRRQGLRAVDGRVALRAHAHCRAGGRHYRAGTGRHGGVHEAAQGLRCAPLRYAAHAPETG
jgi:alkylation response protein AidB-like acyl-CoA dehydrogenase